MKLVGIILAILVFGCAGSEFTSTTKTASPPTSGSNLNNLELPKDEARVKECKINLDYNPQDIKCAIPFSVTDSIWEYVGGSYRQRFNFMRGFDTVAQIISPEPTVLHPGYGSKMCSLVPGVDELIYVSHLVVPAAGEFSVASLIDDEGSVYFWKDGNPGDQISVPGNNIVDQRITLNAGRYVVVVTAHDRGQTTNGMGLSVKRIDSGEVVLRSMNTGTDWCIFRTAHDGLDLAAFVPAAAQCRPCFTGQAN